LVLQLIKIEYLNLEILTHGEFGKATKISLYWGIAPTKIISHGDNLEELFENFYQSMTFFEVSIESMKKLDMFANQRNK
jgi:hypothetical protein